MTIIAKNSVYYNQKIKFLRSVAQLFKKCCKIIRKRGIKLHIFSSRRMCDAEYLCMQCLSLQFKRTFCGTVHTVSKNGMSDTCHVHADLVGTPGL